MFFKERFIDGVQDKRVPLTLVPFLSSTVMGWPVDDGMFIKKRTNFIESDRVYIMLGIGSGGLCSWFSWLRDMKIQSN